MKYLITTALIATASTASAEYLPYQYAYEAAVDLFGDGQQNVLAHEFANCPVKSGSLDQLFEVAQSSGEGRVAALDAIFESDPAAVNCLIEVIARYDLVDEAELAQ